MVLQESGPLPGCLERRLPAPRATLDEALDVDLAHREVERGEEFEQPPRARELVHPAQRDRAVAHHRGAGDARVPGQLADQLARQAARIGVVGQLDQTMPQRDGDALIARESRIALLQRAIRRQRTGPVLLLIVMFRELEEGRVLRTDGATIGHSPALHAQPLRQSTIIRTPTRNCAPAPVTPAPTKKGLAAAG